MGNGHLWMKTSPFRKDLFHVSLANCMNTTQEAREHEGWWGSGCFGSSHGFVAVVRKLASSGDAAEVETQISTLWLVV